ncbi:MAG: hypothetical protein JWP04_2865 [Belnapia sp.]|jgi:hypothetical protein|nr:hypothetical protein [Belnapia sp.]
MRLPTALLGAFLSMAMGGALAGAAAAAGQFHPAMPGLVGLIAEYIRCGDPPDGALLAFDVLDEAEFLGILDEQGPDPAEPLAPEALLR